MTSTLMRRVTESDADPATAEAFAVIRHELGSSFVPSIYQNLATCPPALEATVDVLPRITALARRINFEHHAQALAARGLAASRSPMPERLVIDNAAHDVIAGYRSANPFNLLVALTLVGTGAAEWPGVMTPPLPTVDGAEALSDQIVRAHGGVLLPGLWSSLLNISQAADPWRLCESSAAADRLRGPRADVRSLAEEALSAAGLASVDGILGDPLRPELNHLLWFPTGIATMIVEAELIIDATQIEQQTTPRTIREDKT